MTRIFLLTTLSLFTVCVFAQLNQVDEKGRKTGQWQKTYENSSVVRYKGQFKEDKPYGKFEYFEPSRKPSMVLQYLSPSKANATIFFKDGKSTLATGQYLNQKKDSVWTISHEKGRIVTRENYVDGVKQGKAFTYHKNGTLLGEVEYDNDLKNGVSKMYYDNEKVQTKSNYSAGKLDGFYEEFDFYGKKAFEGYYSNGRMIGEWNYFNEDGTIHYTTVQKGLEVDTVIKKNGEFIEYYDNRTPKSIQRYKNSKLHGKCVEYFNNGELKVTEEQDPRTGTMKFVQRIEGQTEKRQANYITNKLHGEVKVFDEFGKVEKLERYNMGQLID